MEYAVKATKVSANAEAPKTGVFMPFSQPNTISLRGYQFIL